MSTIKPTNYSLIHRETTKQAFTEVILPYLREHHPDLIESAFFAVGSSVAYGLADEHSDIDLLLILPVEEYAARENYWICWAYENPGLVELSRQKNVEINVGVSTWQREGVSILFDGQGSWDDFYGHQHWVQSLIPIHDPRGQMQTIHKSLIQVPDGLAERDAEQCSRLLAGLRDIHQRLSEGGNERFVGLLGYSIASRALPLLFHRQNEPLPFHKWQWLLAERLGEVSRSVLRQLRAMLERQIDGDFSFPEGLIGSEVGSITSREFPLPVGISLQPDQVDRALKSVQWHLCERGEYQMVRALERERHEASLHYMCATRCLLIKGAILLEAGRISCGEDVSVMWEQVNESILGLEECLWPRANEDPFRKTLEGIDIFRQKLRDKQALPEQYLDRPISSPPTYELECILEEL